MSCITEIPDLYLNINWELFEKQEDFQLTSEVQDEGNHAGIRERLKGNINCTDKLYIYQEIFGQEIKVSPSEKNYDGYFKIGFVSRRCHLISSKRYTVKNGENKLIFNVIKESQHRHKCEDENNVVIATMAKSETTVEKNLSLKFEQRNQLAYFTNLILVVAVLVYSDYYIPKERLGRVDNLRRIIRHNIKWILGLVLSFSVFVIGTTSFAWYK